MKYKLCTFLLAHSFCCAVAAEDKFIVCYGTSHTEGVNVPEHAKIYLSDKKTEVFQRYLVRDGAISVLDSNLETKIDTLRLCAKTDTAYIYSWDCSVLDPNSMAQEWTQEGRPLDQNSKFRKKWLRFPESYIGANRIYLNRVTLALTDDKYSFHMSTRDDKSGKPTNIPQNYVLISRLNFQCEIEKPKL